MVKIMELRKLIRPVIEKSFVEEAKDSSTDSKELLNILSDTEYVNHIAERPSGEYLHEIDMTIDESYRNELIDLLTEHNWYIAKGANRTSITISKKYIPESKAKIPPKLYHTTPTKNITEILRNGLVSKSEDLRHKYPPRIYVADSVRVIKQLATELARYTGESDYSIIEIDTKGIKFDLYKDPTCAYRGCYYIQDITKIPNKKLTEIQ